MPLSRGVLQGSVLDPILFTLYMLPLGSIIARHNLYFHCYTDDLQIHLPVMSKETDTLDALFNCSSDIYQWLSQNFLHLHESKTECNVLGTPGMPNNAVSNCGPLASYFKPAGKNLLVVFDSCLKCDKQIDSCQSELFQLRPLTKVKPFLTQSDLKRAIHAFISSRLDYCNGLYVGVCQSSLSRLHLVQHAAAHPLTNYSLH